MTILNILLVKARASAEQGQARRGVDDWYRHGPSINYVFGYRDPKVDSDLGMWRRLYHHDTRKMGYFKAGHITLSRK